ncbi:hypothetical protein HC891_00435 [Candidatus Gracilibacteria bacterium]|nr:hypothetical protein [Candidatus Gracilibacteria bacterium]
MDTNFYAYQQRVLRVLLAWGLINGVAGLPFVLTRSSFWQQFGWQMSGWARSTLRSPFSGCAAPMPTPPATLARPGQRRRTTRRRELSP